jgi:hypothetical protein
MSHVTESDDIRQLNFDIEFASRLERKKRKRSVAIPTVLPQGNPVPPLIRTDLEEPGGETIQVRQTADHSSNHIINPTDNQNISDVEIQEASDVFAGPEMVTEINHELATDRIEDSKIGGAGVLRIDGHRWNSGQLQFKVLWDTDQSTWEDFRIIKVDHPRLTARYMVDNQVSRAGSIKADRNQTWAHKTLRDIRRAIRRNQQLFDEADPESRGAATPEVEAESSERSRRNKVLSKGSKKKKKKKSFGGIKFKYGIEVPRNVSHALQLDRINKNQLWNDAIKKEMDSLIRMECFEFHKEKFVPIGEYQKTSLTMIFDVKQDLRRKARLVAGGHLVDSRDNNVYSSTVKGISVRMLHVIAHKQNLKLLCGDVGNAYVNAYTNELVYSKCGLEFGPELVGKTVIIKKALYGLKTSSERWWSHFADTLRGLGFCGTRYDKDVWIRESNRPGNYEYVCTHSDDFMIVSKKPNDIMEAIKATYDVKSEGQPDYYLGNDYKKDSKGRWCFGCKRYIKEALTRVESIFGTLKKSTVPIFAGDHPESDDTAVLDDDMHRKYQMLIGILNWAVTIGRIDIAFSTMSLSRFSACPRIGHLERVLKIFGYLKKRPNRRICVDSGDPVFVNFNDDFEQDFVVQLGEDYPGACEEIDLRLPIPIVPELTISAFVDSDHAHDKITRRSVTGLIVFVGKTPVFYSSKRQGAIETSTYGAEFCAMKTAVEEIISIRYMLRSLGVRVEHATYLFGDNLGVVQNATIKESLLKKKHVAISYHKVREAAASGIVHPMKIDGKYNFADVCTKAQTNVTFHTLVGGMMFG